MEPQPGDFCVYAATSHADLPTLITALNRGQFENPPSQTQWSPPQNPPPPDSSTGFALAAHHRQHHGILDEEYYVLCDRDDWASDSGTILAVSLDFGGYVDAVRMQVGVAGDSIPSMSIANTDWEESLAGDRWPKDKFAVYITAKDGNVDADALVKALNAGLGGRKAWTAGGGVCRDATALLPEGGEDVDVGAVARLHGSVAEKELFDPNFFIVVERADWESVGVSLVRIGSQGELDVSGKPAEYAAEILTWVDQGFCTWVEGKAWSK